CAAAILSIWCCFPVDGTTGGAVAGIVVTAERLFTTIQAEGYPPADTRQCLAFSQISSFFQLVRSNRKRRPASSHADVCRAFLTGSSGSIQPCLSYCRDAGGVGGNGGIQCVSTARCRCLARGAIGKTVGRSTSGAHPAGHAGHGCLVVAGAISVCCRVW